MDSIKLNGVQLEVQHITPPNAQMDLAPLVFLHEGLGSVSMWRDWPTQLCLATARAGWVYSRRGYGQSDAVPDVRGPSRVEGGQRIGRLLPDYLHHEAWDVLPALLAALGVAQPVLVGHSDGASIALLYACRYPVAACVVMAPHVVVEDVSVRAITETRAAYQASGDRNSLRTRLSRYHANVDCAFWQWNDVWLSDEFRSFDIRGDCQRISAPLLAIQGMDDPYGTMLQVDALAAGKLGPDSDSLHKNGQKSPSIMNRQLYKLEQCGHSPHRDQTALTTHRLVEFLADMV